MNHQNNKNSSKTIADNRRVRFGLVKKIAVLMGLVVVVAVTVGVLFYSSDRGIIREQDDFEKLVGDWVRSDGGYVIRISDINPDGTIRADYFNPNPIHVGQATISSQNNAVKLFVELRDAGYPGCTYDLSYDQETDILNGIYYQAAIQQRFSVVFQRTK